MKEGVILLVEDNPDDEALTLRALRKHNIANPIIVAHDGVEALDFLFGSGALANPASEQTPMLIMLDIKLPRVDGLEVLRRVRSDVRTRTVPVVILTSSNEDQDILKGYQLGTNSYVCKPVTFEDFVKAVGMLGVYWLMVNESPK